jgi:hypothetical protein
MKRTKINEESNYDDLYGTEDGGIEPNMDSDDVTDSDLKFEKMDIDT